ncbi:prepilin peptidase [Neisseria lisongii]|uniref:Prepilin leader peptidase/N-methyltransferase n=1 Tax=Neisseria lisongii TaxID=2912188 RepID=A0AAW5AKI4_9NEIS|nr:A24 family peptidase [Neisseria lisongii]MCF7530081.1 A24 family peptidase [Neisseria lisongii]
MTALSDLFRQLDTPTLLLFCAFIGGIVGSFLNVVIYRLPLMMEREFTLFAKTHLQQPLAPEETQTFNLFRPASHCPKCRTPLNMRQNIPIFGYLLSGGKCRHCGQGFGGRYLRVECVTAVLFAAAAWRFGAGIALIGILAFTSALISLAEIDADTHYLPDQITLPLLWLGLLLNSDGLYVPLQSAVIGAAAGYLALWLPNAVFHKLTGQTGMGHGDFKLLAALGAWNGVEMLAFTVFAASLAGLVAALLLRVKKGQYFAFGPALAVAGWCAAVFRTPIQTAFEYWLGNPIF